MTAAIMICDDEPVSVRPIVDRLEYEGMDVETTTNATDCLAKASRKDYDLFMLDMQLGPNNPRQLWYGLELAKELVKEDLADKSSIIGITGHMPDKKQDALAFGMARFLEKPYSVEEVWTDIAEILESRPPRDVDEVVHEVVLGSTIYTLRRPLRALRKSGVYTLEGLAGRVEGHGETHEEARHRFEVELHQQFQKISTTRPAFRSDEERRIWEALEEAVDVPKYNEQRILSIPHEVGQLVEIDQEGRLVVEWHGGEQSKLDLRGDVPAELASFEEGQWFKAFVQRRRSTYELLRVLHVAPLSRPPLYSEEERARLWNQRDGE